MMDCKTKLEWYYIFRGCRDLECSVCYLDLVEGKFYEYPFWPE